MIKEEIPYVVYGGIRFFERKEIKDVLSYLRLVVLEDDLSFLRVINYPARGLGKKYIKSLVNKADELKQTLFSTLVNSINEKTFNKQGAVEFIDLINDFKKNEKSLKISDLVKYVLDKTGISNELKTDGDQVRLENIQELVNSILYLEKENDETLYLSDYLQEISSKLDSISFYDIAQYNNSKEIIRVKVDKERRHFNEIIVLVSNRDALYCISFKGKIPSKKVINLVKPENVGAITNLDRFKH